MSAPTSFDKDLIFITGVPPTSCTWFSNIFFILHLISFSPRGYFFLTATLTINGTFADLYLTPFTRSLIKNGIRAFPSKSYNLEIFTPSFVKLLFVFCPRFATPSSLG